MDKESEIHPYTEEGRTSSEMCRHNWQDLCISNRLLSCFQQVNADFQARTFSTPWGEMEDG